MQISNGNMHCQSGTESAKISRELLGIANLCGSQGQH